MFLGIVASYTGCLTAGSGCSEKTDGTTWTGSVKLLQACGTTRRPWRGIGFRTDPQYWTALWPCGLPRFIIGQELQKWWRVICFRDNRVIHLASSTSILRREYVRRQPQAMPNTRSFYVGCTRRRVLWFQILFGGQHDLSILKQVSLSAPSQGVCTNPCSSYSRLNVPHYWNRTYWTRPLPR